MDKRAFAREGEAWCNNRGTEEIGSITGVRKRSLAVPTGRRLMEDIYEARMFMKTQQVSEELRVLDDRTRVSSH